MPENEERRTNSILPWVEASTLLGTILVGAIATSAITLYRIDSLEDKVDTLVESVNSINVIKSEIATIKQNNEQTAMIFSKFSDSVDRLSTTLAKLEGKVEAMGEVNGSKR